MNKIGKLSYFNAKIKQKIKHLWKKFKYHIQVKN